MESRTFHGFSRVALCHIVTWFMDVREPRSGHYLLEQEGEGCLMEGGPSSLPPISSPRVQSTVMCNVQIMIPRGRRGPKGADGVKTVRRHLRQRGLVLWTLLGQSWRRDGSLGT